MLKQLPLHFVEYQFQQPLMWNCYKFLKCSLLKWEYSVSKAHIHAATKEKKQWSSNFLYMNFTKNLALWNSPQISLQLRFVFNWKDLQKSPKYFKTTPWSFYSELAWYFHAKWYNGDTVLQITKNSTNQVTFLFAKHEYTPVSSHTAHGPTACSRNCQRKQFTGTEKAETTWTGSVHATTRLHCTIEILTKCPQKCQEATSKF